jgi:uncharacterized protein (UPF0332 family)
MKLSDEERNALIQLKLERADETIKEIPFLVEQGFYRNAANRMYYACFYAVSALMLKNCYEAHSHNGIITLFSMKFVRTNIVSKEEGKLYRSLFELRQTGDYDDTKVIEKEDIVSRLQPAERFIEIIKGLITK